MTYAEDFLSNRYAQIATKIGHQYKKTPDWMHLTAKALMCADLKRQEEKGKVMSNDHLKQAAVKLT